MGHNMTRIETYNLVMRSLMEFGVVGGFAFWGYQTGWNTFTKILLAILAPVVGFGIWGMIDFRNAGSWSERLRLIEELAISALAAWALYISGLPALGWGLAAITIVYHISVYASGGKLLKE
jgi:hypothetical protein